MKGQIKLKDKYRLLSNLSNQMKENCDGNNLDPSVEVDKLQELFDKSVGLEKEEAPYVPPKPGPKMTHQELKAMKHTTTNMNAHKVQLFRKVSLVLIRIGFLVKSWFQFKEDPRKVCQQQGHECSHCGLNVPYQHEQPGKQMLNENC